MIRKTPPHMFYFRTNYPFWVWSLKISKSLGLQSDNRKLSLLEPD